MNRQQRRTLARIFTKPTPVEMEWEDIERLFVALGATIQQRAGSRVAVMLNERVGNFHVPHRRGRRANQGRIAAVRQFLENAGVELEDVSIKPENAESEP